MFQFQQHLCSCQRSFIRFPTVCDSLTSPASCFNSQTLSFSGPVYWTACDALVLPLVFIILGFIDVLPFSSA